MELLNKSGLLNEIYTYNSFIEIKWSGVLRIMDLQFEGNHLNWDF
jgi:hypothetical protein